MTDWSQFLPSLIATLVGFGLALLGEWIVRSISKKVQAKDLKRQLSNEVENILKKIDELEKNTMLSEDNPLRIPVWKTAISSNSLNVLDKTTRSVFMRLYDNIEAYNSWYSRKTDILLSIYDKEMAGKKDVLGENRDLANSSFLEKINKKIKQIADDVRKLAVSVTPKEKSENK